MIFIKTYEDFSGTQSLSKIDNKELDNRITMSKQQDIIANKLLSNMPVFKSFKDSMQSIGADVVSDNDKVLKLFNKKKSFVYIPNQTLFNNDQFRELQTALRKQIPYFFQDWHDWMTIWENKQRYKDLPDDEKSILLDYNCIVYGVIETDENEKLPFGIICELGNFTEEEAKWAIESKIDGIIDMTCNSVCENWYPVAIVNMSQSKVLKIE